MRKPPRSSRLSCAEVAIRKQRSMFDLPAPRRPFKLKSESCAESIIRVKRPFWSETLSYQFRKSPT